MRAIAYFTPDEAAEVLNVTRRWIYELLLTGRLGGHQRKGFWRIRPADIRRYRKRRDQQNGARR